MLRLGQAHAVGPMLCRQMRPCLQDGMHKAVKSPSSTLCELWEQMSLWCSCEIAAA